MSARRDSDGQAPGLATALGSVASAVRSPAAHWRAWRESRRRLREELEALEDRLAPGAAEVAEAAADGQYVPWESVKREVGLRRGRAHASEQ